MTGYLRIVEKGIRAQLAAATALTALVGTRIYSTQAPLEAALPHVVFSIAGGGNENDAPKDAFDLTLTVRGVGAMADSATQVADAIFDALHRTDVALDAPWDSYACTQQTPFYYTENVERKTYHHAGGNYRLRGVVR